MEEWRSRVTKNILERHPEARSKVQQPAFQTAGNVGGLRAPESRAPEGDRTGAFIGSESGRSTSISLSSEP